MDYHQKIRELKEKVRARETELGTVKAELLRAEEGSDTQKYLRAEVQAIRHSIDVINEQITAIKLLLPLAVAHSDAQSDDNSESVASTSHYAGLNQFQVHIPSEYDTKLRPNITQEFGTVPGACIEAR